MISSSIEWLEYRIIHVAVDVLKSHTRSIGFAVWRGARYAPWNWTWKPRKPAELFACLNGRMTRYGAFDVVRASARSLCAPGPRVLFQRLYFYRSRASHGKVFDAWRRKIHGSLAFIVRFDSRHVERQSDIRFPPNSFCRLPAWPVNCKIESFERSIPRAYIRQFVSFKARPCVNRTCPVSTREFLDVVAFASWSLQRTTNYSEIL